MNTKRLTNALIIASLLWCVMFTRVLSDSLSFWGEMCVAAVILLTFAFFNRWEQWRGRFVVDWKNIVAGVAIAVVLWGVFWVGDKLSAMIIPFARQQVDSIYVLKEQSNVAFITIALLFLIGPAEELFWRGYVQEGLEQKMGANWGYVVTTAIYTLIHVPSMNFMLVCAAMVCGTLWGGLYRLFPRYLTAIVLSHALWDAAVFVFFPIM